jgi:hypothetical protein
VTFKFEIKMNGQMRWERKNGTKNGIHRNSDCENTFLRKQVILVVSKTTILRNRVKSTKILSFSLPPRLPYPRDL